MSNWMPSLNALRAFEAVARHLSYQTAAVELNVTPAAVKQLVYKLEKSVGTDLILRKGRGLTLTPRGTASAVDLGKAMELIAGSVRSMRAETKTTRLFVSVEASFATAWLVPRLHRFRARHPDVTVLVDSNQEIAELGSGAMDIGIRYGVSRTSGLIAHRLFQDEVFPACSPSLIRAGTDLTKLEDLTHVPLIHWDVSNQPWARETSRWFTWDNWLRREDQTDLSTGNGLHFSEYGQAVQAAIAGQGVILASWPILRESFRAGLLFAPFEERQITDIGYELVISAEKTDRPEVAAFVDWMLEEAEKERVGRPTEPSFSTNG